MNLGDLRTNFLSLLSRDDCTTAQANLFISQGMQRMQRSLRIPSMERLQVWNSVAATATAITQIQIPNDLIQPIDILVQSDGSIPGYRLGDLVPMDKLSFRELQRVPIGFGPRAYARYQAAFYIRGTVAQTCELQLYYYGEFSPLLTGDASENEIMASSPDLVTYAALSLAGDYFNHPMMDSWEQRYQGYLQEIISMAADVDANGGPQVIASAHGSGAYGVYY